MSKLKYKDGTRLKIIGIPGLDVLRGEEGDFLRDSNIEVITVFHSKRYSGAYEIRELCDEFGDEFGWSHEFIESTRNFKIAVITNWKKHLGGG